MHRSRRRLTKLPSQLAKVFAQYPQPVDRLVEWLNSSGNRTGGQRVRALLADIRKVESLDTSTVPKSQAELRLAIAAQALQLKLLSKIESILNRYEFHYRLDRIFLGGSEWFAFLEGRKIRREFLLPSISDEITRYYDDPFGESDAISEIVDLTKRGRLNRLAECR